MRRDDVADAVAPPDRPRRGLDPVAYAVLAIGAALVVAMLVVLLVVDREGPDIAWRTLEVKVGDPRQVTVTFEVDKPPLSSAECQVTAFDEKRNDAGRLTGILVGPSAERSRTVRMTVLVPTLDKPATTASVATCQIVRAR